MLKQRKVNGQSVSRQLATSSENLVASTQFLVALATSESQFRALLSVFLVILSMILSFLFSMFLPILFLIHETFFPVGFVIFSPCLTNFLSIVLTVSFFGLRNSLRVLFSVLGFGFLLSRLCIIFSSLSSSSISFFLFSRQRWWGHRSLELVPPITTTKV